jgi:hypothetical protein
MLTALFVTRPSRRIQISAAAFSKQLVAMTRKCVLCSYHTQEGQTHKIQNKFGATTYFDSRYNTTTHTTDDKLPEPKGSEQL